MTCVTDGGGKAAAVAPVIDMRLRSGCKVQPEQSLSIGLHRRPFSMKFREAKYKIGQVVRHRFYPFRGVVFDVDPMFNNTEEWWLAIPEDIRPEKDQPFYHLLAENADTEYIAYVSEQNLIPDTSGEPVRHPQVREYLDAGPNGKYRFRRAQAH